MYTVTFELNWARLFILHVFRIFIIFSKTATEHNSQGLYIFSLNACKFYPHRNFVIGSYFSLNVKMFRILKNSLRMFQDRKKKCRLLVY